MKFLCLIFSLLILFTNFRGNEMFTHSSINAKQNRNTDWSELFPEIPNCERVIQPLTQNNEVFEQIAVYEREGYKNNKNENYFGCGSITLRFEPFARKKAREDFKRSDYLPFRQVFRIKELDAYSESPQCGNDVWMGSTAIYFDEDKALILSAYLGADKILKFAQSADYLLIEKSMNKLVKNQSQLKLK